MNILFSTTRQWNPGDEFILRGVRTLLDAADFQYNPIIWNRHPSTRPGNVRLDNSFDECRHELSAIDYVIFAGTPEWIGSRVDPLYDIILSRNLRCSFLGIGSHGGVEQLSSQYRQVLAENADLIVCRDQNTRDAIRAQLPQSLPSLMPCPSIFHARQARPRSEIKKVGVLYQTTHTTWQNLSKNERDILLRLTEILKKRIDVSIICNYIDEWAEASQIFGSSAVQYSFDSADYERFFDHCDCVIGYRVHGCLGAISTGCPAILLGTGNDKRRLGASQQVPVLTTVDESDPYRIAEQILGLPAATQSARIINFRDAQWSKYLPEIRRISKSRTIRDLSPHQCQEILASNEVRIAHAPDRASTQPPKNRASSFFRRFIGK